MTFSITARCARTGQCGVGIATYSPIVGARCPLVVPQRGAGSIQSVANPVLLPIARGLIESGHAAKNVVDRVVAADPYPGIRQVAVVDAYGGAYAFTGADNAAWAGQRVGAGYAVIGNMLAGAGVVEAMERAFLAAEAEPLAERLMRAVEAGRDAGGQNEGQNSAALLVGGDAPFPIVDLRVDLNDAPEAELRRLWEWYRPMVPFYIERAFARKVPRWWEWRMANVPGWVARHLRK